MRRHRAGLEEHHVVQEADYRKLVSEAKDEGGRAAERAQLQQSHAGAVAAAKQREATERSARAVMARRTELLGKILDLRDRRFMARKQVADRLTRTLSSIRVSITQAADSAHYRETIARALKGLPLKQNLVAERLTEAFLPTELARAVVAGDARQIAERASLDEERTRRVIDALRVDGIAYRPRGRRSRGRALHRAARWRQVQGVTEPVHRAALHDDPADPARAERAPAPHRPAGGQP